MRSATPPRRGDVVLWDTEVRGYGCKVTASGARVLLFQYWSPVDGKRRRVTFGKLGEPYEDPNPSRKPLTLSATTGRELARVLWAEVRARRDPFLDREAAAAAQLAERERRKTEDRARKEAERRAQQGRETLADVAARALAGWWESVALPVGSSRRLSRTTVRERERQLRKHILPALGSRPVREIGKQDVEAMRRAMGTKRPILANRVQQLCHLLLNEAERDGRPNPFALGKRRAGQWFEERETREALTRDELARLFAALDADNEWERGGAHDAIRLLALTGWRKSEALSLRWDAVDLATGEVRLPDTKTGVSERSLPPVALDLLASIPRVGPYVFPSPQDPDAPRTEVKRVWNRLRAAAAVTKPLHALRHTVGTLALSEGATLAEVGALLGHKTPTTTLRYAKVEREKRKVAAAKVGATLAPLMRPKGAKVLPMRKAK